MVHEGGWQLVKTNDGRIVTVGPMVHFGVTPSHSWRGDAADGGEAGPDWSAITTGSIRVH